VHEYRYRIEKRLKATFFVVADVVDHFLSGLGGINPIVSANSLYNKTDSSLEGVSSYPYHPKKNGLEIGEERKIVDFPCAYWNVFGFNFKIPTSGGDSEMKIGKCLN
jgi:hypothetical protein